MGCKAHPDRVETRACRHCSAHWCSECPRKIVNREICPDCGHQVQRFVVKHSISESVVDALRRVMSLEGMVTALALAVPRVLGEYVWIFSWIYLAALAGYYFVIIRHVGDSREGMPGPSDTVDDWTSTIGMAFRGVVCYLVGFLPLVIWLVYAATHVGPRLDGPDFAPTDFAPPDPMPDESGEASRSGGSHFDRSQVGRPIATMIGLVLAGQLYMPAVVLSVALTNTTWGALWPPVWIKVIARAPGAYVRFAMVWIGSLAVGIGLSISTALLLPPTVISAFVVAFLWCMFWFAQAVLVGNYIRENASAFGWDQSEGVADDIVAPVRERESTARTPITQMASLLRGKLSFAVQTADINAGGIDARREDGTLVLVVWADVIGVVVRRLPPDYEGATFVDVVSNAGSTLRVLPWTKLGGDPIDGDGVARAHALVQLITTRSPNVQLDRGTREFVGSRSALQLPDVATLEVHDAKLA